MARTLKTRTNKSEKARFSPGVDTAPAPLTPIADNYDLPNEYGTTTIALIARDPYWIYAYWEVSQASFDAAKKELGLDFTHAKMALRMYDVTHVDFNGENANSHFDLDVGHARNWYINLWKDNVSYCAEIGMKTLTGRFYAFARSNITTTPRAHMSWRREEIWMKTTEREIRAPYVNVEVSGPKAQQGENIIRKAMKRNSGSNNFREKTLAEETCPLIRARRAKRIFLTDDDIRAYYYGISPLLRELLKGRFMRRGSAYERGGLYFHLKFSSPNLTDILMNKRGLARRRIGASEEILRKV